ncbi:hypothetical protein [Streptomyces sp. GMY02]|uniref:S10 family serine carboxypeptidase-like protein n=1 Tax=Streptomyces sp. GMY02 TaxID=1333528 RepID=UPI00349F58D4
MRRRAISARPVVFLFNGGPGSSSQWLHLGGLGPRRVRPATDLRSGSLPPYETEESPATLLATTDLVFIDPLSTGLSRAANADTQAHAYSITADAKQFARVIHTWCAREGHIDSAKYVLGESYGTVRAGCLARELLHGPSPIALNGIILLSQAVNLQETAQRSGNITSRVAALPFIATVAWYHGVASAGHDTAERATRAALDYTYGDYASVLFRGSLATASEADDAATRLQGITRIPAETWGRNRLQNTKGDFRRLVLRDRNQVIGTMDARYLAVAEDRATSERDIDPTHARIVPAYVAATERYLTEHLGIATGDGYRSFNQRAFPQWWWRDESAPMGGYGSGNPTGPSQAIPVSVTQSTSHVTPASQLTLPCGPYRAPPDPFRPATRDSA